MPATSMTRSGTIFFLSKGHDVPALYGTFAEWACWKKSRFKKSPLTGRHIYGTLIAFPGNWNFIQVLWGICTVSIGVAHGHKNKGAAKTRLILILWANCGIK